MGRKERLYKRSREGKSDGTSGVVGVGGAQEGESKMPPKFCP